MVEVEIWSDIVCPFCFIGKQNFETALEKFPQRDQVKVTWRSFELDSNAPKSQKVKIEEVLAQKYGRSVEWARQMNQNLANQAQTVGLSFQFEKIIPSNSFDAHRLLHLASQEGKQNQMSELLFKAYFMDGKDIADFATLESLAVQAGIHIEKARACLNSNEFSEAVRNEEKQAYEFSISGVPAFVFNRQFLVSGAQPPEAFLEALKEAVSPSQEKSDQ